jgi:hypothetical protein
MQVKMANYSYPHMFDDQGAVQGLFTTQQVDLNMAHAHNHTIPSRATLLWQLYTALLLFIAIICTVMLVGATSSNSTACASW